MLVYSSGNQLVKGTWTIQAFMYTTEVSRGRKMIDGGHHGEPTGELDPVGVMGKVFSGEFRGPSLHDPMKWKGILNHRMYFFAQL